MLPRLNISTSFKEFNKFNIKSQVLLNKEKPDIKKLDL